MTCFPAFSDKGYQRHPAFLGMSFLRVRVPSFADCRVKASSPSASQCRRSWHQLTKSQHIRNHLQANIMSATGSKTAHPIGSPRFHIAADGSPPVILYHFRCYITLALLDSCNYKALRYLNFRLL